MIITPPPPPQTDQAPGDVMKMSFYWENEIGLHDSCVGTGGGGEPGEWGQCRVSK